jgi:AcrR family transcriptional regulator
MPCNIMHAGVHVKWDQMPRTYSMKKRSAVADATRERLLEATAEVVADGGAQALTMQAVAERADVALRTVYNYFASREELARAAYDRVATSIVDAVQALPPTGSARGDLLAFVGTYLDGYQGELAAKAVIAGIPGVSDVEKRVDEVRRWRRDRLARFVRSAQREEGLKVTTADAIGLAFLTTAFATWEVLVVQLGMSPLAAKTLLLTTLEARLFS